MVAISVLVVTSVIKPDIFLPTLNTFYGLLVRVIPVLILVFIFVFLFNFFLTPKQIAHYLGRSSGLGGWLLSIIFGIFSEGPIYIWYPLLSDLQKQGVRQAFIVAFLYNRAIKLPILPVAVFYFGLPFVIAMAGFMVLFSIINGLIVEKILQSKRLGIVRQK